MIIFVVTIGGLTVFVVGFAVRMAWEKYCVRTKRPFRSWLP